MVLAITWRLRSMFCSFLKLALEPNQMTSILDGFSWRHLEAHHLCPHIHTVLYLWCRGTDVTQQKMINKLAIVCINVRILIVFFNHCWKIICVCYKLYLHVQGDKFWNVNTSKMVRASKKILKHNFYIDWYLPSNGTNECCSPRPLPKFSRSNFSNSYFGMKRMKKCKHYYCHQIGSEVFAIKWHNCKYCT